MKKPFVGIMFGAVAGIIDVVPMIIQQLTWDANLSAFSMWVVVGFLISTTDIKLKPIPKGILVAFITILPTAILIGWKEPKTLIPIGIFTLILGGTLGYSINKVLNK
jgi:hypothetical protein